MTLASQRLVELGIEQPPAAKPAVNYTPTTEHGTLMYVSGQLPKEDGQVRITGTLGEDVSIHDAQRAARICVLQGLACAAEHLGSIDAVQQVLMVTGYVASASTFHDQPKIIDAASGLLGEIFGDSGRHARAAIGVASLPRRSPVEISMVLAVSPPAA
jgi:enamine deaminase RidA (YjgF/YER057c/UK114 family)